MTFRFCRRPPSDSTTDPDPQEGKARFWMETACVGGSRWMPADIALDG